MDLLSKYSFDFMIGGLYEPTWFDSIVTTSFTIKYNPQIFNIFFFSFHFFVHESVQVEEHFEYPNQMSSIIAHGVENTLELYPSVQLGSRLLH